MIHNPLQLIYHAVFSPAFFFVVVVERVLEMVLNIIKCDVLIDADTSSDSVAVVIKSVK